MDEEKEMKIKEAILIIFILFALSGCKKKEPEQPATVRPSSFLQEIEFKEPEPEQYIYEDSGRRDPFVPLVEPRLGRIAPGERLEEMKVVIKTEEAETETTGLETFELSGLVWDSQGEVGLITSENKSFTLFNGKLSDEEGNPLEDIKGERKKDEIVLTKRDKSATLKIKEKENEGEGEVK
ncbi:hypothetical protein KKG61_07935 [bacterium]|nr:hypothetical protein [bacterium]MBU1600012.1 hypothetical protein [bacterium]MBU2462285.1 hypothetical protein [bacterium]